MAPSGAGDLLDIIRRSRSRGHRILIGRNHVGRIKIKILSGPFGMFVRRYETDHVTLGEIRQVLAES